MKVAAYQAPLLPSGSREAVDLIRTRVEWCESHGVVILCCPEAILAVWRTMPPIPANLRLTRRSARSLACPARERYGHEDLIVADLEAALREPRAIR